jgi:peptidoglycan/xylan/chitin deacetylase (PgdA/CDA1 family)
MALALRDVRRICLEGLDRMGGLNLVVNSRWRNRRLLILAFHGISLDDEHEWNGALYVTPNVLADRLRALREMGCTILPLDEAIERLYAGTLPHQSVAVTFDDGYHDFAVRAHPILEEYMIPATVYLTTLRCGVDFPMFTLACSYVLWKARGTRVHVPELRQEPLDLRTDRGRADALTAANVVAARDQLSLADKDRLVHRIAAQAGVDYTAIAARRLLTIMSPDHVARLSNRGVAFELHTHSHNAPNDHPKFLAEIETNRARIEGMTGRPPRHFCYPSGNYNAEFPGWLSAAGVASATTCDPGLASAATSPMLLPRLVVTSTIGSGEFRAWLAGAACLVTPRRSYAADAH